MVSTYIVSNHIFASFYPKRHQENLSVVILVVNPLISLGYFF